MHSHAKEQKEQLSRAGFEPARPKPYELESYPLDPSGTETKHSLTATFSDPWTPTKVYQEVVSAMEHIKHGRMEAAANALDGLGPHLEENLDMLLHISVLMQHLGRQEHMKWTLDMAAFVHPNDPHVQQARAQLLV